VRLILASTQVKAQTLFARDVAVEKAENIDDAYSSGLLRKYLVEL
jgi:hypothetical protein